MTDRVRIGRLPIDRLTFEGALDATERMIADKKGGTVFTPNVDHIVMAEHDPAFREAYERASLSLVDGKPVLWAARALGPGLPEKISGSDFVPALLDRAAKRDFSVYLLGGAPGSAERARAVLEERHIRVAGFSSPKVAVSAKLDDHRELAETIARANPDLVLVGLGAPKQELFSYAVRDIVRPAVLIGCGATIDFLAGVVPRAPTWISNAGLEWLYRLAKEPRRLWRRYLLRDPEFALVVLRQMRGGLKKSTA
jgi:N-acetylglucosaminyldiphosphoundecaprenol N-acetyl-beta-D-mannosaminyltransferase